VEACRLDREISVRKRRLIPCKMICNQEVPSRSSVIALYIDIGYNRCYRCYMVTNPVQYLNDYILLISHILTHRALESFLEAPTWRANCWCLMTGNLAIGLPGARIGWGSA
jgi:hypothetical protein